MSIFQQFSKQFTTSHFSANQYTTAKQQQPKKRHTGKQIVFCYIFTDVFQTIPHYYQPTLTLLSCLLNLFFITVVYRLPIQFFPFSWETLSCNHKGIAISNYLVGSIQFWFLSHSKSDRGERYKIRTSVWDNTEN